ncbi:helix-turn-helix domain-containing protein [Streptomyces sp. NPDC059783]|uniref:helix-turn-helix domain-containing protein n=1 Tax=Streptomyces sp. NPDC059783 TaxID=3346944 RepID=UPI00365D240F
MKVDGQKIRRRRELSGYGLRRFATAAGVSAGQLSKVERGQHDPRPEFLARVAAALKCPAVELLPETSGDEHERSAPTAHR